MTRVDGRNRCSSASFTIERRGRKGRKEKLHFVAAFAQRSLFASDYRRPHSASSVQEHSASSVPSTLRRQFPSTLRRQFPERCPCYHSPQLPEVLSCAT